MKRDRAHPCRERGAEDACAMPATRAHNGWEGEPPIACLTAGGRGWHAWHPQPRGAPTHINRKKRN